MITRFTDVDQTLYSSLFEEAEDILCGFRQALEYEAGITTYYKKLYTRSELIAAELADISMSNEDALKLMYEEVEILGPNVFFSELAAAGKLYVKDTNISIDDRDETTGCVNGYLVMRGITTLDEYFNWIGFIKLGGIKFLMLPLYEMINGVFEIDANTRTINVPNDFKKNGVAVQGDRNAELLWFSIDRYFDIHDFASDTVKIEINWENKNTKRPYEVTDILPYEGKIYFCWNLSKSAASISGPLKFSIHIFGENFDFYTQSASVNINAGLNFEGQKVEYDDGLDSLLVGLNNSPTVGGIVSASEPYFIEGHTLPLYADLNENNQIVLQSLAASDDTGIITYNWFWTPEEATNKESLKTTDYANINVANTYQEIIEPANAKYNNKTLYTFNETTQKYEPYTGNRNNVEVPLYAVAAQCVIAIESIKENALNGVTTDITGTYQLEAQNRLNYSTNIIDTPQSVIVPGPVDAIIKPWADQHGFIGNNVSYTPKRDLENSDINYNADDHTVTNYVWKYNPAVMANFDVAEGWVDVDTDEITEDNICTPKKVGYYRVEATNVRNNKTSGIGISDAIRVTYSPIAPESIATSNGKLKFIDTDLMQGTDKIVLSINNPAGNLYDAFIIEYVYKDEYGTELATGEGVVEADDEFTYEINWPEFAKEVTATGGNLYVTVRTKLNGKESDAKAMESEITIQ